MQMLNNAQALNACDNRPAAYSAEPAAISEPKLSGGGALASVACTLVLAALRFAMQIRGNYRQK